MLYIVFILILANSMFTTPTTPNYSVIKQEMIDHYKEVIKTQDAGRRTQDAGRRTHYS